MPKSYIFIALVILVFSCKRTKETNTDKDLYDLAKTTEGFVWYKHSEDLLEKSEGSGHPQPYLRTRYNSVASTQLDSLGKVKPNASFPTGSLIVKELHSDLSTLARYAILYKDPSNENADARGWVWGYINTDGGVAVSAENEGTACINCHSQEGSIDYMLMNISFP